MFVLDAREPTFMHYGRTRADSGDYWDAVLTDYWATLRRGGVGAIVADAAYVTDDFRAVAKGVAQWVERTRAVPAALVRSVDELFAARSAGRIAVILACHSASAFGDDLELIGALHAMGVRVMGLTFHQRNLVGDGCGEPTDGGLSAYGRTAVRELNRVGMAIDLSHASDRTMVDAIETSAAPVFFSHSNARSLVPHRRTVPDEVLVELARRGGVVCATPWADFLRPAAGDEHPSLASYVEMITHLVGLVGIDHVGIGTDIVESVTAIEKVAACGTTLIGGADAGGRYATGVRSRAALPAVLEALGAAGLAEPDIRKFMAENVIRFLGEVWGASAR